MSTDGTRDIVDDFRRDHPELRLRLIDNPERSIPSALNRAIAASRGEIVVRLDAHAVPAPDYLDRCLAALKATNAANVGGRWLIEPGGEGWMARSIAAAVGDPLGSGDARYRTGGRAGPVDTVPFGAFPRAWLERAGGYDESLLTNEDYELNWRLRRMGGTVWFDPEIRCVYYARPDLTSLIRQYSRYGFWKAQMVRRHPDSLRWRQVVPAASVVGWVVLAAAALVYRPAGWLLLAGVVLYGALLAWRGIVLAVRQRRWTHLLGVPVALATIHLTWGAGFLAGLAAGSSRRAARATP
jgi:cellulose synthase/poly-beta-1,6-N-acetylglucosamine synthase-like glycosyltransferase